MKKTSLLVSFATLCSGFFSPGFAQNLSIDQKSSLFAAVTNRAGIAAKLAHHHLITAGSPTVELKGNLESLPSVTFSFQAKVDQFVVDNPSQQKDLQTRLLNLKAIPEGFSDLSDSDREKIRENMLAKDQLDAKSFPEISATFSDLQATPFKVSGEIFSHSGVLAVTIKGKKVSKKVGIKVETVAGNVDVESLVPLKFSEFGIQPFSALLGAIKNSDSFYIYVKAKLNK